MHVGWVRVEHVRDREPVCSRVYCDDRCAHPATLPLVVGKHALAAPEGARIPHLGLSGFGRSLRPVVDGAARGKRTTDYFALAQVRMYCGKATRDEKLHASLAGARVYGAS